MRSQKDDVCRIITFKSRGDSWNLHGQSTAAYSTAEYKLISVLDLRETIILFFWENKPEKKESNLNVRL